MIPQKVTVESFTIIGPQVETMNTLEIREDTAQIPTAWDDLMATIGKISNDDSPTTYGAYFDYESDYQGQYKVIAGVEYSDLEEASCEKVQIAAGDYLKFSFKGEIPEAVIKGWQAIWTYFEENPSIKREYVTDYEQYSPEGVDIFIGISG